MYSALSPTERQKLFQDLVETSHDLIWQCDDEGRYTYLNPAWEAIVGYTREEMLGRRYSDFIPAESVERSVDQFSRIRQGEETNNFQTVFTAKTGRTVHLLLNAKCIFDADGNFIGARGTALDITERLHAETALKESEERFRSVLDNSLDVIYRFNLQTRRYDYMSPSAENVLGYSPDEFMKLDAVTAINLIHPADLPRVETTLARLEETGIEKAEYRFRIRNGTYRWLSNNMTLTKDQAGKPLYREGNIRDITESKQAEDVLRKSEQRLKFHFENSPLAVVEWDGDFVVTQWSIEAERIFGYTKDETLGKKLDSLQLIHEHDIPVVERTMHRLVGGNERTVISANRNYTKSGAVIDCVWYNSVLLDQDGRMSSVMSLVQNVTEQKRTENALLESKQRAYAILNAASESIWLFNIQGDILGANEVAAHRFGMAVADMVGKNMDEFLPPSISRSRRAKIDEMIASGNPVHFEDERNGIIFNHTFNPINDASGKITAFAAFSRDVTQLKQAEDLLKRSEEQFRTIANAIPHLAWIAGSDGVASWFNDRWYQYMGTNHGTNKGWKPEDIHDPSILPVVRQRWAESFASATPFEMEFPLKGADNVFRPFLVRVMPVKNERGEAIQWIATATDVSDHHRKELELDQLYRQARHDGIVKTELLNEVNHRVKNNLMVILGLILAEKRQAIKDGRQEVEVLSEKFERRIKGLLEVHQMLSDSKWESVKVAYLAERICEGVMNSFTDGEPTVDLCITPSDIEVNSRQASNLALVFNELTINCMKYAFKTCKQPSISIAFHIENERLRIEFSDSGCGYPDPVLTDKRWHVGLRLIHQIIEHTLDGEIQLMNKKGAVAHMFIGLE